jgi:NADH:ubiquinone oxidoreductase subunit 3 (subunit A)
MNIAKLFLGLILMIFFLALSIETPNLFSLSAGAEELIQYGFGALAIFCMVIGVVK